MGISKWGACHIGRIWMARVLLCTLPVQGVWAATTLSSLPQGQDINYGGVSHPRTVQAASNNPASLSASARNGYWFGLLGVAAGYEVGDVNDLQERVDRLSEEFDREDLTQAEAEALKEELDVFLVELGQDGTFKFNANVTPPLFPLGGGLPGIGGDFAIGVGAVAVAKVRILDAPIEVQPVGDGNYELQSRTSAYVKGGGGAVLSLGYSGTALFRPDGRLTVGTRINYYNLELGKGVVAIEDSDDEEDELQDDIEDDFDRNHREDSFIGVDVGVLWTARNYSLGATFRNLNEPSMTYPAIGRNCDDPAMSTSASTNCFTAASFSNRISLDEEMVMNRQLQLEGALYSANREWTLAAAYDMNSTRDLVGDEQQWRSVMGSYIPRSWWMPGFRAGYRENLAGSKLGYYTGGLTLFRILNLDAAMSTEKVEDDGEEIPRSAMFSLSLEFFY